MQMTRLFEIIYLLLNKKNMTARELAAHFGVSQRTIYRDVDALSLARIPIYAEKGKGGGIRLMPEFVLNKSVLSDGEQREILTALQGLSSVRAAEDGQVLHKLSAIFNKSTVPWLDVDFSDWNFSNGNAFHLLKTAILERRVVEFDYFSSFGEKTCRRVEPMQLWFKHRAWYLKGFCLTRCDIRLFKLIRVKNISVSDDHFGHRDLSALSPIPSGHEKQMITVKLRIAPEMAWRVHDEFSEEQIIRQPDGGYMAEATWPEDHWVYGFLLSFGEYIEVLSPAHIRHILRDKAQKMAHIYTNEEETT